MIVRRDAVRGIATGQGDCSLSTKSLARQRRGDYAAVLDPNTAKVEAVLQAHGLDIFDTLEGTVPEDVAVALNERTRIEAWLIRRALEHNGGRKDLTARKLGVTREGLYK
jgi:DNA-binding NtrC family response regulator